MTTTLKAAGQPPAGSRLRLVMRHPSEFRVRPEKKGREAGMCIIGESEKFDMPKTTELEEYVDVASGTEAK